MANQKVQYHNIEHKGREAFYDMISNHQPLLDEFDDLLIVDRASAEERNNQRRTFIIIEEIGYEGEDDVDEHARLAPPTDSKPKKKIYKPQLPITIRVPRAKQLRIVAGLIRDAVDKNRQELARRNVHRVEPDNSDVPDPEILPEEEGEKVFYEHTMNYNFRWEGR